MQGFFLLTLALLLDELVSLEPLQDFRLAFTVSNGQHGQQLNEKIKFYKTKITKFRPLCVFQLKPAEQLVSYRALLR